MEPQQVNFAALLEHQKEALEKIVGNDFQQVNPAIISLPTGTGKTAVLITTPFILKAKRMLVIAPDLEIFKQLKEELMGKKREPQNMILYNLGFLSYGTRLPSVEAVSTTRELDEPTLRGRDIVLANVDKFHTLKSSTWQKILPRNLFDLIIVDEAHHLPSDKWKFVVEHFRPTKLVFLTATPYRGNGGSIVSSLTRPLCNGKLLYHFQLAKAIEKYVKCCLTFLIAFRNCIKKPIFSNLSSSPDDPTVRVITQVAKTLAKRNQGRNQDKFYQGMVIALDQDDADNILKQWKDNQLEQFATAEAYHTGIKKKDRPAIKMRFKERQTHVLIVVQMLKEGFDHPPVSVIGIVRKIGSPLLFTQFIGRAFRIIRGQDRLADPHYDQIANIITAEEFKQQKNWDSFQEERLIPTDK